MGGGGNSAPSKTTQTQKLDPFLQQQIRQNVQNIRGLEPFQPIPGGPNAQLTPAMQQQLQSMQGLGQAGQGLLAQGATGLGDVAGTQAQQVSAGQADISQFMNPFTDQVVNQTLGDIDRARQMAVNQTQDQSIAQGAFGGSRSALLESETNRGFADRAAAASGQLRNQGFMTALDAAQNQQQMGLQAGMANQGAGLDAARLRLLGNQGLLGAGGQLFGMGQQAAQFGQDRAQAARDFQIQQQMQQQMDPRTLAQLESSAIQGIPFFGSTSGTSMQPGGSRLGQGIGGGLSGAATGAAIGSVVPGFGTGIGAAVGGGLGLLGGMFG